MKLVYHDPGPWVVTLRADQMSRLIDLARGSREKA